jgi:hypothetical protein
MAWGEHSALNNQHEVSGQQSAFSIQREVSSQHSAFSQTQGRLRSLNTSIMNTSESRLGIGSLSAKPLTTIHRKGREGRQGAEIFLH